MVKYEKPVIEVVDLDNNDILTASGGFPASFITETQTVSEGSGIWG